MLTSCKNKLAMLPQEIGLPNLYCSDLYSPIVVNISSYDTSFYSWVFQSYVGRELKSTITPNGTNYRQNVVSKQYLTLIVNKTQYLLFSKKSDTINGQLKTITLDYSECVKPILRYLSSTQRLLELIWTRWKKSALVHIAMLTRLETSQRHRLSKSNWVSNFGNTLASWCWQKQLPIVRSSTEA